MALPNAVLKFIPLAEYDYDVLPEGMHECSEAVFYSFFVESFSNFNSSTRKIIYEEYDKFKYSISSFSPLEYWLNGSFVESKINPNDLDIVVFFDMELLDSLPVNLQEKFKSIFLNKSKQLIDSYYCPVVSEANPNYTLWKARQDYWRKWWGNTRTCQPKGFVAIKGEEPASHE